MKILIIALTSISSIASEMTMKCEKLSSGMRNPDIYRCENAEVICYTTGTTEAAPIFCKFKEAK